MNEKDNMNLSGLPKEHGFNTPDRYFEQLPMRVMQRTTGAAAEGAMSQGKWFWQFKTVLAGSAMVLVFVVSFLGTHTWEMARLNPDAELAKLQGKDITQYLLNNTELETTDLAEFAAVKVPQLLEFIEVRQEDVNLDAAMEVMEDKEEFQSIR